MEGWLASLLVTYERVLFLCKFLSFNFMPIDYEHWTEKVGDAIDVHATSGTGITKPVARILILEVRALASQSDD